MELIRRARDNDPWAADQLCGATRKRSTDCLPACGFDAEEARDTAQEALLQVFRNLGQFEGRSRFSTWLHRIAVNACLDARRRRKRWFRMILPRRTERRDEGIRRPSRQHSGPGEWHGPVQVSAAPSSTGRMGALRRLSEHQRTVFSSRYFRDEHTE